MLEIARKSSRGKSMNGKESNKECLFNNNLIIPDPYKILEAYGCENQICVAGEEMSELTHALMRWLRNDRASDADLMDNISEEIADVLYLLQQLTISFGITTDEINKRIFYKHQRTLIEAENFDSLD